MTRLTSRRWLDAKGKKRPLITKYSQVRTWQLIGKGKIDYTPYIMVALSTVIAIVFIALAFLADQADRDTDVNDFDGDFMVDDPDAYNDGPWSFQLGWFPGGVGNANESQDIDDFVNAYGEDEEVESIAYYRGYPEISAIDYIVFSILGFMIPLAFYGKYKAESKDRIEQKFPDFLRDLAEFWKGGLSMTVAVETLAKGEYGYLNEEVNKMATQISWGISFGEVLKMFTERVDSQIVMQAISMVDEANKAGGRISDILLAASFDAKEIKSLQMERTLNVGSYVAVIYTSFLVYLIIIIILAFTFVPAIAESSAETSASDSGGSIGNMKITRLDPIWIATIFFWSIVIQAVGNGMAAGFMKTGQVYGGLLQATYLLSFSWGLYELLGIQTSLHGISNLPGA